MSDDRRAALEAAFDEHEEIATNEEQKVSSPEASEPLSTIADDADAPQLEVVADKPAKVRDPVGKFAKSDKVAPDKDLVPANGKPAKTAVTDPISTVESKGPASWRPEIRQKFGALPPEVQAEVTRRETQIEQTLRQTADQRNYAQSINQLITPYDAMIRAEGGNHITAVDNLLKTAYQLRTANPQSKAMLVAQMIKQHSVDTALLDNALYQIFGGGPANQPQAGPDPMMAHFQQELAPIKQFVQSIQQRQQQNEQETGQTLLTEAKAFAADPKNVYIEDVREDMADLLEMAARRGVKMSLSDAYTRATLAHPEIGKLVMHSQASASAAQRSAAARRARNASASLPSGGTPDGAADHATRPNDRRSAIAAAWDSIEGREV